MIIAKEYMTLTDTQTQNYCEIWLEASHANLDADPELEAIFRVALLVPKGMAIPAGFVRDDNQTMLPDRVFYVSGWLEKIADADSLMGDVGAFFSSRGLKFLMFREMRPMRSVPPVDI